MNSELSDRVTRLEADQSHHRDDMRSLRLSIESLRKVNWRHISVSLSAIVFTAIVLICAGQMYFSLVGVNHGVEDKLETKITAFDDRLSAVENRMSSLEDQMVKGFENLISIIENIPFNSNSKKLSALTEY